MDLIYTDSKKNDIGVLTDYILDMAYGRDENNFELSVYAGNHKCEPGSFVYIEETEYGGVIDEFDVYTESMIITYAGRTWHGILNGKVLEPDKGEDYLLLQGEANAVLNDIIQRVNLETVFSVNPTDSGIYVQHKVRYGMAYDTICSMLAENLGKLKISYREGKVNLSAEWLADYSENEEWDSSQMNFQIKKNYRPINHLICLGTGDLKDRHVIHLFTDENGGILPYKKTENPLEDNDYILDRSSQLLFGTDEVAAIYDFPNAETTESYVYMQKQPEDWESSYSNYFKKEDNGYKELEGHDETVYAPQYEQPYDWSSNYRDYFQKNEDGNFVNISEYSEEVYIALEEKPYDWLFYYDSYYFYNIATLKYEKINKEDRPTVVNYILQTFDNCSVVLWPYNYGDYYYYYSDGVKSEYRSVNGVSKERYNVQTQRPTDWITNYKSYYKLVGVCTYTYNEYEKKNNKWVLKRTYTSSNSQEAMKSNKKKIVSAGVTFKYEYKTLTAKKAPEWKAKKYYTKETYQVAPAFESGKYYAKNEQKVAPEFRYDADHSRSNYYRKELKEVPDWEPGKYYTKQQVFVIPGWGEEQYYEKKIDNFAVLVSNGIEKLKESYDCDCIEANFLPDEAYDIGDIVGATDNVTGVSVWQPITKKVVKIQKGIETVEYEIGGQS